MASNGVMLIISKLQTGLFPTNYTASANISGLQFCLRNALATSPAKAIKMAKMIFNKNHNCVAYLDDVPEGKELFASMIEGLKNSRIVYAISADPAIYSELIDSFWSTAALEKDQAGNPIITATVKDKRVTVSQAILNRILLFDDQEGAPTRLDDDVVIDCLTRMGYEYRYPSLEKKWLPPYWKYLFHVVIHCLSNLKAGMDSLSAVFGSLLVSLVDDLPFSISGVIFQEMQKNVTANPGRKFIMYPRFIQLVINDAYSELATLRSPKYVVQTIKKEIFTHLTGARGNKCSGESFAKIGRFYEIEEDVGDLGGDVQTDEAQTGTSASAARNDIDQEIERLFEDEPMNEERMEDVVHSASSSETASDQIGNVSYVIQTDQTPSTPTSSRLNVEDRDTDYIPEESPSTSMRRKRMARRKDFPARKRGRGGIPRKPRTHVIITETEQPIISDIRRSPEKDMTEEEQIADVTTTAAETETVPVSESANIPGSGFSTPPRQENLEFDVDTFLNTPADFQGREESTSAPHSITLEERVKNLEKESFENVKLIAELRKDNEEKTKMITMIHLNSAIKDTRIASLEQQMKSMFDYSSGLERQLNELREFISQIYFHQPPVIRSTTVVGETSRRSPSPSPAEN